MRAALVRYASTRLLKGQPDHILVELSCDGHEPAFEAIVSRYRQYLLRVARGTGSAEQAEDVVQQTFLQAYRALQAKEEVAELRPWLRRIALNVSVDLARRTARSEVTRAEERAGGGIESILEERRRVARLVTGLLELPDRQREAIIMREFEGRACEEIASEFGVSGAAVRQLLRRARARLRAGAAAVVPAALVTRMLAYSASHTDAAAGRSAEAIGATGLGLGPKTAVVAASCTALVLGTSAAPLDHVPSERRVTRSPTVAQGAEGNRRAPREHTHRTPAAVPPAQRSAPPVPAGPEGRPGRHEGENDPAPAAESGPRDGQEQDGEGRNDNGVPEREAHEARSGGPEDRVDGQEGQSGEGPGGANG